MIDESFTYLGEPHGGEPAGARPLGVAGEAAQARFAVVLGDGRRPKAQTPLGRGAELALGVQRCVHVIVA